MPEDGRRARRRPRRDGAGGVGADRQRARTPRRSGRAGRASVRHRHRQRDFWVLRVALREYRPRLVVAEYNAAFPPGKFWTRRNAPMEHGTRRSGTARASTRSPGSRHVPVTSSSRASRVVQRVLRARRLGRRRGSRSTPARRPVPALVIALPRSAIPRASNPIARGSRNRSSHRCASATRASSQRRGSTPIVVGVLARIENATRHRLSSTGPTPLRLSAHVLDDEGRVARFDASGTGSTAASRRTVPPGRVECSASTRDDAPSCA